MRSTPDAASQVPGRLAHTIDESDACFSDLGRAGRTRTSTRKSFRKTSTDRTNSLCAARRDFGDAGRRSPAFRTDVGSAAIVRAAGR